MKKVERKIIINASFSKVLILVQDLEKYPSYVPSIKKMEILHKDEEARKYKLRVHSTLPILNKDVYSDQEMEYFLEEKEARFHFQEIPGGIFSHLKGKRVITAKDNQVEFHSEIEYIIKNMLFGNLFESAIQSLIFSNMEHLQEKIKLEAERI